MLARAEGVLTGIEAALVAAQIPYRVLSGTALLPAPEVKAALAHLTLLVNPHDAEAFSRVMLDARRGIGEVTAARVDAHAVAASISLLEASVRADHLSRVRRDQKATLIAFGRAMLELRAQLERRSVSSLLADVVRLPDGLADTLAGQDDGGAACSGCATSSPRRAPTSATPHARARSTFSPAPRWPAAPTTAEVSPSASA